MPDLRPFRGIRYDARAGSSRDLVAPPYDIIGPQEHVELCRRSPHNVVRLILGERTSPAAEPSADWYAAAASQWSAWQREGVLRRDAEPAFYLYTQEFACQGRRLRRKLLLGALRLEPYEAGHVLPHENTLAGPKADRLRLMTACPANLSPILAFFPDRTGSINDLLERASGVVPDVVFADDGGIRHELRCIRDEGHQATLHDALAPLPLYIADGHHRYETALAYQRIRLAAMVGPQVEHPYDFMLAACMSAADPGLVIRPTHRMLRWQGAPEVQDLLGRARVWFGVERLPNATVQDALEAMDRRRERPAFVVYDAGTKGFTFMGLRDDAALDASPYPSGSPVRHLPAAVLAHGFIGRLLAAASPTLTYTPEAAEAVREASEGRARLAALLPGVLPSELMAVVDAGERMPPKSTYFWPKPLTGMVFRSLEAL